MLSKCNIRFTKPTIQSKHNILYSRLCLSNSYFGYNVIDRLTDKNKCLYKEIDEMKITMLDINKRNDSNERKITELQDNLDKYKSLGDIEDIKRKIVDLQDNLDKYKSFGDIEDIKSKLRDYHKISPIYITVKDAPTTDMGKLQSLVIRLIILALTCYTIIVVPKIAVWIALFWYIMRIFLRNDPIGIAFIVFVVYMAIVYIETPVIFFVKIII